MAEWSPHMVPFLPLKLPCDPSRAMTHIFRNIKVTVTFPLKPNIFNFKTTVMAEVMTGRTQPHTSIIAGCNSSRVSTTKTQVRKSFFIIIHFVRSRVVADTLSYRTVVMLRQENGTQYTEVQINTYPPRATGEHPRDNFPNMARQTEKSTRVSR